jgi:hypothetical protein
VWAQVSSASREKEAVKDKPQIKRTCNQKNATINMGIELWGEGNIRVAGEDLRVEN